MKKRFFLLIATILFLIKPVVAMREVEEMETVELTKTYFSLRNTQSTNSVEDEEIEEIPSQHRKYNMEQVLRWFIKDQVVLDIGTGNGIKARRIQGFGAKEVWGVEPDKQEALKAKNSLSPEHVLDGRVQDLDDSFHGKFDIVTIINFCLPCKEIPEVAEKASKLLKNEGKLIIGASDGAYIKGKDRFFHVFSEQFIETYCLSLSTPPRSLFIDRLALVFEKRSDSTPHTLMD